MLSLLVAVSENGVIGKDGDIPWYISSDLRRFKLLTLGHTVVMGRKTLESIVTRLGKPLPDRKNTVLTRQSDFHLAGVEVITEDRLQEMSLDTEEIFVIGGSEVYQLALPMAKQVYLTRVDAKIEGDAFFPNLPEEEWGLTAAMRYPASEKDEYSYSFQLFGRR